MSIQKYNDAFILESQFMLTLKGNALSAQVTSWDGFARFRHGHSPPLTLTASELALFLSLLLPRNAVISFRQFRRRYSEMKGRKFTLLHLRHLKISPCLHI